MNYVAYEKSSNILYIRGPRQSGRTTALIENALRDPNSIIVVLNHEQVKDLKRRLYSRLLAEKNLKRIPLVCTYTALIKSYLPIDNYNYYIDNYDHVLKMTDPPLKIMKNIKVVTIEGPVLITQHTVEDCML
jgi:hypothetical protein